MSVAALVLAAGRGERLGQRLPKAFVALAGRPLLLHALEALASAGEISRLVPVIAEADLERYRALASSLAALPGLAEPAFGGSERQDSVRAGLESLPADVTLVVIHDAARPLVRPAMVSRVIAEAREFGAAILAAPARDTIKRVRDGQILETPDRRECFAAQTPQVFRTELLREALAKAAADGFRGTDDAHLVERLGVAVRIVPGGPENLKITDPEDLSVAEAWLRRGGGDATP